MEMRQDIEERLRATPFTPFIVVMNSDDRYEINDPVIAALSATLLHIARPTKDGFDVLNMRQITSAEVLEPAA